MSGSQKQAFTESLAAYVGRPSYTTDRDDQPEAEQVVEPYAYGPA